MVDAVTSVLVVIKLGRACVGLSQSQHWQWLVVGEGDLSHGEAPAKLSTGTGDSTTSAGAFRSQLRPGRRSNILHPHLPPPTTHHHPDTNKHCPTYIIQLKISTPLTVTIDCPRLAGLRIIESCQVLGPPQPCQGVLSAQAETA